MLRDSQGRRLWIRDELGGFSPVRTQADIHGRQRGRGRPDWWVVAKSPDWPPPGQPEGPKSLLSLGVVEDAGAGDGHTKIGAGHKPQGYDERGRYTGPNGGAADMATGKVRLYADGAGEEPDADEPEAEAEEAQNSEEVYRELEGVLVADSGRVLTDAGGGTGRTDNEAWRLQEKQYTPEKLVQNARAEVGSDKWYPKQDGDKTYNQCNIFVADKLHETGAPVPSVGGYSGVFGPGASDWLHEQSGGSMGGHAPSASDWANASKEIPGYQVVTVPQPGDVASNGAHVGIVTGAGKTVSVTSREDRPEEYGHVVENNWGFRKENEGTMIFRRYNGPALRRMQ